MSLAPSFFNVTTKSKLDRAAPLNVGNFGVAVSLAASGGASVTAIGSDDFAESPCASRVSW